MFRGCFKVTNQAAAQKGHATSIAGTMNAGLEHSVDALDAEGFTVQFPAATCSDFAVHSGEMRM